MKKLLITPSALRSMTERLVPYSEQLVALTHGVSSVYIRKPWEKKEGFSLTISEMCASHTYMISIFNLCFSGVSFYLYDCL